MGICRSGRLSLARLLVMSPLVAMRVAWLMAEVVTPSSAARSARGRMTSSGCSRLALVETFEKPGNRADLALHLRGRGGHDSGVVAGELDLHRAIAGGPLPCPPARMRTPGMAAISSTMAVCSSCCVRLRSLRSFSVMNMLALRGLTSANTFSTSLYLPRRWRTSSAALTVSCKPRTGRQLDVEADVTEIRRRREAPGQGGGQREGRRSSPAVEASKRLPAVLQRPAHLAQVPELEATRFVAMRRGAHELRGHHRRERARHQQREQHGDGGGEAEGLEELPRRCRT